MIQSILQFIETHKSTDVALSAWITREVPLVWGWIKTSAWPRLVAIYPYVRDNGGIFGVAKNFLVGKPQQQLQNQTEQK